MYLVFKLSTRHFLFDFNQISNFWTGFHEVPIIILNLNPSSGSRADIRRQTDRRMDSLTQFQSILWLFIDARNINRYLDLHVKWPTFVPHFNYPWIFSTDFRIRPYIKFHENPPSGSRAYTYGQTNGHDESNRPKNKAPHTIYNTKQIRRRKWWDYKEEDDKHINTLCARKKWAHTSGQAQKKKWLEKWFGKFGQYTRFSPRQQEEVMSAVRVVNCAHRHK